MGKNEEASAEAIIGLFSSIVLHQNADNRTNEWASKLVGRSLQRRENFSYGKGTNFNAGMNTGTNTSWGTSSSSGGSSEGGSNWSSGSNRGGGENYGDNRGRGRSENTSHGFSETMDNRIEPAFFSYGLKCGGPANGGEVTALWFMNGGRFVANGGAPYLHVTYQQGRL